MNEIDVNCTGLERLNHAGRVGLGILQTESIKSLISQCFSVYRQVLKWFEVFCSGEVEEGNRKTVSF